MADVAQLVRALVCGTRCREFESHLPPHIEIKPLKIGAFLLLKMLVFRWDTGVGHKGGTQSNQNRVKICHHFQADLRRLDKIWIYGIPAKMSLWFSCQIKTSVLLLF